jgi:D-glycero-beta-D-manno-heptose 1-phosphate adenylyltransferase
MRVVLAAGCFDLFHVAHLRYLEQAKAMGDYLMVSVTEDKNVGKGPNRPVIPERERLEIVQGLRCVDEAFLYPDGVDALMQKRPQIFVKGHDWKVRGLPPSITRFCAQNGIEIRFTDPNPHVTTGKVIERLKCA